jgi:oxygen-independent coproporphyrinogen-3 oxidase
LEERAMLGLRLRSGLDLDVVRMLNPQSSKPISELVADGLLDGREALLGRAVLTLRGRLLADLVLRKVLGL